MNQLQAKEKDRSSMIQIDTRSLGTIDVNPDSYITFPEGLFGFGKYTEYVIIPDPGDFPFEWLQSTQSSELAFILIQPNDIFSSIYKPEVALPELKQLEVTAIQECRVYTTVTIPESDPQEMTANFQGPVLINEQNKVGRQIISLNADHKIRVRILDLLDA